MFLTIYFRSFNCNFYEQVGDGTTTVVLFAGEFLKEAKPFIEDGVHPQNLIRSYRTACNLVFELNLVTFLYVFCDAWTIPNVLNI